jgi:ribosomal protein S18 acetylase RimI-like enzyme
MSLTTTTSNPARRLYERFGFDLIETREDASYLAATGIAGRILMVKKLD